MLAPRLRGIGVEGTERERRTTRSRFESAGCLETNSRTETYCAARTLEPPPQRALSRVVGRHHCRASDGRCVPAPCYCCPTVTGLICLVRPPVSHGARGIRCPAFLRTSTAVRAVFTPSRHGMQSLMSRAGGNERSRFLPRARCVAIVVSCSAESSSCHWSHRQIGSTSLHQQLMGHQFRNEPTPRSNTCAVAISARIFLPMYRRDAPNTGRASTNRFVVSVQCELGRNPRLLGYRHQTICLPTDGVASRVGDNKESTSLRARNTMGPVWGSQSTEGEGGGRGS
jgi:hypothetical protein